MKPSLDPVVRDELYFDRMMEAQEVIDEQGREAAEEMFACGELDDEIRDIVADQCNDAVTIALHHAYAIRSTNAYGIAMKDFRATVDQIITDAGRRWVEDR